jgi:type IV pilus assembly protein PilB
MAIETAQLKILLLGSNLLQLEQFDAAEKEAKKKGISLEEYLPATGLITDIHLGQTIANFLKMSFADLHREQITGDALQVLPEVVARARQTVIFRITESQIILASSGSDDYELVKMLERKTNKEVLSFYATPTAIKETLRLYKGDLHDQIESLIKNLADGMEQEETIVDVVNIILEYAHDNRASDIHIEPSEEEVVVRFRIDGLLHEVVSYGKALHDQVVLRLKIMAHLPIDEHDTAQDGRFDYQTEDARFDVRLSIMPITQGENVVMRLLAESARRITLEELGLDGSDLEKVKLATGRPHGMILSAGPTGAGKTTTLYAILQILNEPDVNIATIEDPVEYALEGTHQTQVNAKKNLTFATGLRSIVRQDPDIILVGEIRDAETADIAVNAAMTGHLLLSTLHANDAATALPRLIDLGIEPFLVSSSVNVVVAQRLVRRVCERCKTSCFFSKEELALIKGDAELLSIIQELSKHKDISALRLYHGTGKDESNQTCKVCIGTGYLGRIGVFEVMELTDELRLLITQKASAGEIAKKAIEHGMKPMIKDGINKVLQGMTTFQEVMGNIKS